MLSRCFAAAWACFWFPGNGVAADHVVDLELVLAADISSSIDLEEAKLQRQGFVRAFRHRDVIEAIQRGLLGRIAVTYVEWASEHYQKTLVDWAEVTDASSAAAFAAAVEWPGVETGVWTSIGTAIAYGERSFEGNGFHSERRIIDISGDGPNNRGINVILARDHALARGIVINGLPIINDRPDRYGYLPMPDLDLYYKDCVIGGEGAFIIVANGIQDFARAIRRKLVLEIAGQAPVPQYLRLAAGRPRPPCNAGEIRLKNRQPYLYDF